MGNADAPARTPGQRAQPDQRQQITDEIKQYADCRYIGPCQAYHRLCGFPLHGAKPPVERLSVHLPDEQIIYYQEGQEDEIIRDAGAPPTSKLLEYFKAVIASRSITPQLNYKRASEITYQDLPRHYTWSNKRWKPRNISKTYPVLGRMYQVAPTAANSELYYLRSLLTRVIGPTGFEDLRTYAGEEYATFQEACRARGLLQDDQEWFIYLREACESVTSIHKLRELFVIVLYHNKPSNPPLLWDTFKEHLSDDYRRLREQDNGFVVEDFDAALYDIQDILAEPHYQHKTLESFLLPRPVNPRSRLQRNRYEEVIDTEAEEQLYQEMFQTMNADQQSVLQVLIDATSQLHDNSSPKCFFLDAPGGTGKTYVLNAFIHHCRSNQLNMIVSAYSGVAANLLIGGRTAHSQFKFPLNQDSTDCTNSHIKPTEAVGKRVLAAQVIIIDEGPMMHRKFWELLHVACLELYNRTNHIYHQPGALTTPYAGKLIICSGDLRQCLPVIRHGDRTAIVQNVLNRSTLLWSNFTQLRLTINERVMRNTTGLLQQERDLCEQFSSNLLRIGNGEVPLLDPDQAIDIT